MCKGQPQLVKLVLTIASKTLVIHSQCSVVAKLASHQRQYVQTLSSNFNSRNPSKPRTQNCTEQPKHANDVSTLSKRQSQYLTLQSGSTGIKGPIRAIFSSECRGNYISARIVRRFTLRSYDDPTANTSMVVAGERNITPTRNYVALITPIGLGDDQSPHRFFVVEHCLQNFDILIGSDIITKLPALAKHDEPIGPIRPIRSKP